ncbi:hypothetical protein [Paenibacillus ginsengarvi]|uniref:hypothetical protein n=1 Tax=Paenibacillus ginsengarvi TaxID=400777 RepID=UPI00131569E6|nr:hypothetical protein [Paenibacillus ginsengarvi]
MRSTTGRFARNRAESDQVGVRTVAVSRKAGVNRMKVRAYAALRLTAYAGRLESG